MPDCPTLPPCTAGSITFAEFSDSLARAGYRLSAATVGRIFSNYDEDKAGTLSFDEFVQANAEISIMTSAFRTHDT